jgi:hypothetical protein|nr:MAG TPA_asm: hypothetical protein [Caudoviricetes sp.]
MTKREKAKKLVHDINEVYTIPTYLEEMVVIAITGSLSEIEDQERERSVRAWQRKRDS